MNRARPRRCFRAGGRNVVLLLARHHAPGTAGAAIKIDHQAPFATTPGGRGGGLRALRDRCGE